MGEKFGLETTGFLPLGQYLTQNDQVYMLQLGPNRGTSLQTICSVPIQLTASR